MIKVVVDTGIVISAAFRDRTPEEIILFIVRQDAFEWIVSTAILEEYTTFSTFFYRNQRYLYRDEGMHELRLRLILKQISL